MALQFTFILNITFSAVLSGARLSVSGNRFLFKGEHVFLSGGNLPWINYGYDYGNNQWAGVKGRVEDQLRMLRDAGGNSLRLWIHIQGESSPLFDQGGYVIGTDSQGTFLSDFKDMLNLARSYDILVIPTLWNAAVDQDTHNRLDGLIVDPAKLTSYIRVVLIPLVRELNSEPCYDTFMLILSGAGWAGGKYSYRDMLRSGVFAAFSLLELLGKLDFHDFHSYSFEGSFDSMAAFVHNCSDYGSTRPVVVGEFWRQQGGHRSTNQLFAYVYRHGYSGAWSWDLVHNGPDQRAGIAYISNYTGNGNIHINF
ncbi:hypothetical protein EGW08_009600 [Elysia chlorotica]|uniref:Glycoside hydrolase family 5 domain-containing protein n=1 Tax=Elysia chlorotica TaxID=188477 RepID=A0A433TM32_ELYCH|nr:hypothetical protein EGW08_009600 [Elysia chlorotica]